MITINDMLPKSGVTKIRSSYLFEEMLLVINTICTTRRAFKDKKIFIKFIKKLVTICSKNMAKVQPK